jgi:hypothetical protein
VCLRFETLSYFGHAAEDCLGERHLLAGVAEPLFELAVLCSRWLLSWSESGSGLLQETIGLVEQP